LEKLYRGKGCGSCNNTGYRGRVAIHEVLAINDEIRQMIVDHAPIHELKACALKNGMITLIDDGIDKAGAGITTLQEVIREAVE
jgi:type IV pilus assembly protein PilB